MRYVVLHHTGVAEPHYDVMVETAPGGPLATWRSPAWPWAGPTPLVRLPDHRAAYLDYEGSVSGDRGEVRRVEAGACDLAADGTATSPFTIRFDRDNWWVGEPLTRRARFSGHGDVEPDGAAHAR